MRRDRAHQRTATPIRGVGAVGLAVLLALGGVACSDDDSDAEAGDEATSTSSAATDASPTEAPEDTEDAPGESGGGAPEVEAVDFAFAPDRVEVATGDEVTWTNGDTVTHTVTADDGGFDLGLDGEGATDSHVFADPGEVAYHCSIHESMTGVVVVADD